MSFSHPSADPVVTSPGRSSPRRAGALGRPFLEMIAEAYLSEGRAIPDRVLSSSGEEATVPRASFDQTEESEDEDRTAEDRPSLRSLAIQAPLRGLVADPLSSVAREPAVDSEQGGEASPALPSAFRDRRELQPLPLVVGKAVVLGPHPKKTRGHAQPDASNETTTPSRDGLKSTNRRAPLPKIRILPPVEEERGERFALRPCLVGQPITEALSVLPADVIEERSCRSPPPIPEVTKVRRSVLPPPLPEFAIPSFSPPGDNGGDGRTDPHGRLFSAEQYIFDEAGLREFESFSGDWIVPDDTDPFATVVRTDDGAVACREVTIELSVGVLEELLLMDDGDTSSQGVRTRDDLRVDDLRALASRHRVGFVGTLATCESESAATSDVSPGALTATSPGTFLPILVRSEFREGALGQHLAQSSLSDEAAVVPSHFDVPDAPDLDVKPAAAFTLTGLVLARPTAIGEEGERRRKGHNIFAAAMKDYLEGRRQAAQTNAQLALAYDPTSGVYRAALSRWTKEAKEAEGRPRTVEP